MLTPRELQQIREYLLQYGKKDSQFPVVETMTDNDLVAFVRNNQNLAAHLSDIKDFIGTEIAIGGIDIEGITMGFSEKNFTALLESKLGNIEPDAQVNKLETVKVNGTSLPITDKSVNVELIPTSYVKNYSDPTHPIGEIGNQLLGERDINAKIAESEAEFKGTTPEADMSSVNFKAWLESLTADRNDYVFYIKTYTDERVDDEDDKYVYYRYKYTGATEDITTTPWPCVAGWTYEYQLIPYYLNTDEYPTAGSTNAVASQGIFAFTGDVHKDGNNNYISLQTQIDNIVSGGATLRLTSTKNAALVNETTTFNLTATSDTEASSIKIKLGNTILASGSGTTLTASNVQLTPSSATDTTYTAEFVISGVTKTVTTKVKGVYPIYIGAAATVDYSNIPVTWKQGAKLSPAGTYTIASIGEYIWFIYPATMTITKAKMNGFDFPLEAATSQTVGGVSYKTRRSSAPQEAGKTLTIVIE